MLRMLLVTPAERDPEREACDRCHGLGFCAACDLGTVPAPLPALPLTTWAEECIAKVMGR